jgi:hypothetical protein
MGLVDNFRTAGQDGRLRRYVLLGLIIAVVALLWLIGASSRNDDTNTLQPNEYFDRRSGETVSDPGGKTPDTFGSAAGQPIYLGLGKLLDYGVTIGQLNATKEAFFSYSKTSNANIEEVSIDVASIMSLPSDPSSTQPKQTLTFNVQFDRDKTFDVRLDYFGVSSIRLYLKDTSGKLIFDSKTITWESSSPGE